MNNTTAIAMTQASNSTRKLNPDLFKNGPITVSVMNGKSVAINGVPIVNEVTKALKNRKKESQSEKLRRKFLWAWIAAGGPDLQEEVRFHPLRLWRFDYALKTIKLAIEVDGGVFSNGGHNRGMQITKDHEKRNQALLMGWRCFVLTTKNINAEQIAPIAALAKLLLKKKIK